MVPLTHRNTEEPDGLTHSERPLEIVAEFRLWVDDCGSEWFSLRFSFSSQTVFFASNFSGWVGMTGTFCAVVSYLRHMMTR